MGTTIFDNYNSNDSTVIPDNRYEFLPVESWYKDIMVLNANNHYAFRLPYAAEDIENLIIFYMQGTEHKLQIPKIRITIESPDGQLEHPYCTASYEIYAGETLNFNTYNRETKVQIKTILTDGTIAYSPIYFVKILDSLDANLPEPNNQEVTD